MAKKANLTQDQIARRRIAKKVAAKNATAQAATPLFADQVELATFEDEYWKWRRNKAAEGSADLSLVDRKWNLRLLRAIARQVMAPADFALADSDHQHKFGDVLMYWQDILTGARRIVLEYERIDEGMRTVTFSNGQTTEIPRVSLREKRVWPDPGWVPPLSREQVDKLLAAPVPCDFEGAVDPMGLGEKS
jgi:hypothetical protein